MTWWCIYMTVHALYLLTLLSCSVNFWGGTLCYIDLMKNVICHSFRKGCEALMISEINEIF